MTKVYLVDYNTYLDITEDFPIVLNYSIANINIPSQRTLEFSNQFVVPGTRSNNILFEHIYDIGQSIIDFDPNKKINAIVYVDDVEVIRGYLKYVRSVTTDIFANNSIEYLFELFGERIDFYENLKFLSGDLSDKQIKDLTALQSFTHSFLENEIVDSWQHTWQDAYIYPMLDYGSSALRRMMDSLIKRNVNLTVGDFKPALFAKFVFDNIFEEAGYTYTSNFLNSDEFKKLILPYDKKELIFENQLKDFFVGLSQSQQIGDTGNFGNNFLGDFIEPNKTQNIFIFEPWETRIPFDLDSGVLTGLPLNEDPTLYNVQNNFSLASDSYNSEYEGDYAFYFQINFNLDWDVYFNTAGVEIYDPVYGTILDPIWGTSSTITNPWERMTATLFLCDTTNNTRTYLRDVLLEDGDKVIRNKSYQVAGDLKTIIQLGHDYHLDLVIQADAYVDINANNTLPSPTEFVKPGRTKIRTYLTIEKSVFGSIDGQNQTNQSFKRGNIIDFVTLNGFTMKQKDFINGITNMFNLYYTLEPGTKNFIIEPRDSFYLEDNEIDWTEKIDATTIVQDTIYNSDVNLRYRDDNDYYNKRFVELYDISYGEYIQIINSDLKGDAFRVQTTFSPTPFRKSFVDDKLVVSVIVNDQFGPYDGNQRILFWEGTHSTIYNWTFDNVNYNYYPRATHLENLFGATGLDLNYTYSPPFYSNINGAQFLITDSNLYNAFWFNTIKEVVSPNSRMMRGKINLNPNDINRLDFRKIYRFKDNLYRLNSLQYNATSDDLSDFELIRIEKQSDPQVGSTIIESITSGLENPNDDVDNVIIGKAINTTGIKNVLSGENIIVTGDSNNVFGENVVVNGNRNNLVGFNSMINGNDFKPNYQLRDRILNVGSGDFKNYFDYPVSIPQEGFAYNDSILYIGGQFDRYDGIGLDSIVAIDTLSGRRIPEFQPQFKNYKYDSTRGRINTVTYWNDYIILGGSFQYGLAVLSLTGSYIDTPGMRLNVGNTASVKDNYVKTFYLEGDNLYVGGNFLGFIGGTGSVTLQRRNVCKVDLSGFTASTWGFDAGANNAVIDIDELDTDNLLLGGDFTLYNAQPNIRLVSVSKSTGGIYTTFSTGVGFDSRVNKIISTTQSVYVAGKFSSYQSEPKFGLTKLSMTGSIVASFSTTIESYFTSTSAHNVKNLFLNNDLLYVFGSFNLANGQDVNNFAIVDTQFGTVFNQSSIEMTPGRFVEKGEIMGIDNSNISTYYADSDGIIIGGQFKTYENLDYNSFIKLNYDMTPFSGSITSLYIDDDYIDDDYV